MLQRTASQYRNLRENFLPYAWDNKGLTYGTLIGDSQNQSYLYLGTLIPFKLCLKSEILYFKYVLFMEIWLTYGIAWVSENDLI